MYTGSPPMEPWETEDWQWFHEHRQVVSEGDWLTCPMPSALLDYLNQPNATSPRKFFLAGAACVRRVWHLLERLESRAAVEAAERFADGHLTREELCETSLAAAVYQQWSENDPRFYAALAAGRLCHDIRQNHGNAEHTMYAPDRVTDAIARLAGVAYSAEYEAARYREMRSQANLYRCVAGNPFRPVAFSPEWRTKSAVSLARTMYDVRDFSAMPILADALQDAGCDNADVLNHCRLSGEHVRGCWVVDLVLGRE